MKLKIFFISFAVSIPLWLGVNVLNGRLENFLFLEKIAADPKTMAAALNQQALGQQIEDAGFLKRPNPQALEINAKAGLSILIDENGKKEILFSKNPEEKLAIASLTKLMSAYIVVNYFDLSGDLEIAQGVLLKRGTTENLKPGEIFKIKDILYSSLVESDNDGISALSQLTSQNGFVVLMNLEAGYLGLNDTKFFNSTGLDPENSEEPANFSTARDVALLSSEVFKNPLISQILSSREFDLYDSQNVFNHKSVTTNELLASSDFKNMRIVAGKTGETPRAGGCLVLVLENPSRKQTLVNVILGSDNRFGEMKKLTDWAINSLNYRNYLNTLLY